MHLQHDRTSRRQDVGTRELDLGDVRQEAALSTARVAHDGLKGLRKECK